MPTIVVPVVPLQSFREKSQHAHNVPAETKTLYPNTVIFLPAHPASFYSYFCLKDAKILFQRVPGFNGIADLS